MSGPAIELYSWPTPNGLKVALMLEECGAPYRMRPVDITRGEQFNPHFLRLSPNNKIPAILDPDGPDGEPIAIFESAAILQYLARKTGLFHGRGERERVMVEEWLSWQASGLGPAAALAHHFRIHAPARIDYAMNRATNEMNRLYGVMNRRLQRAEYLAGDYSIADMSCVFWARLASRQGQDIDEFPEIARWLRAIEARPAMRRVLETPRDLRGGPPVAESSGVVASTAA